MSSLQGEYSGFVYSYAVEEPLSVVHKVAGYLPSLFWGFITLGRLISIPVSYRMKPATMVFINVVRLFSRQFGRLAGCWVPRAELVELHQTFLCVTVPARGTAETYNSPALLAPRFI